jgi:WD40 repeat protein
MRPRIFKIPLPSKHFETYAWDPDGTTVVMGCDDREIYLWDSATCIQRATFEGRANAGLLALICVPDADVPVFDHVDFGLQSKRSLLG